jgi:hypothetical protein
VEPEKQPLLGSGFPNTSATRQWFSSGQVITARDAILTMEKWLEVVFSVQSVVGVDEMGTVPEGITGPPRSWKYKLKDLAHQVGGVSNVRQ